MADAFWERVAGQQRLARRKAVTDNFRLKMFMKHYAKLTASILKTLNEQERLQAAVRATLQNIEKAYRSLDDAPASDIYVAMIRGVSSRYHMTADVMERSQLMASIEPEHQLRLGSQRASNGWFLESLERLVLPFSPDQVTQAAWSHFKRNREVENGCYQVEEASADFIRAKFADVAQLDNADLIVRGRFVARRCVDTVRDSHGRCVEHLACG
ncbi:hypothetical protein PINS_up021610 [Pythium insidiosum]|nr:hypothetical protein PINS_up021610 [Pythium insidiosum]